MLTKTVVLGTLSSLISNYVGFFVDLIRSMEAVCDVNCFNVKLVYFERGFYFLCFSFCYFLFCSCQRL